MLTCPKQKNATGCNLSDLVHVGKMGAEGGQYWQSRRPFPGAAKLLVSRENFTLSERASKLAGALTDPQAAPHQTSSCRVQRQDIGGQFSDFSKTKIIGYSSSESTVRSGEQEVLNSVSLTTFFFQVSRQKKGEIERLNVTTKALVLCCSAPWSLIRAGRYL